jgi:hypothetical protein
MTKLGDLYKIEVGKDGKVKVARDEAAALAKLNIPQRIKRRRSPKTRFAKPGEVV